MTHDDRSTWRVDALPPASAGHRRWAALDAQGHAGATLELVERIGREGPARHWYHVGRVVHRAAELGIHHEQQTLLLGNDLAGASELRIGADAEPAALAALLRHVIAAQRPGTTLVAELPGVRDSADQSPFWLGLGRHFHAADPRDELARHGPEWRSHVAALLPRQLVYTSFLPDTARAAIAAHHDSAAALRSTLEAAGFRFRGHVAIDDGGPVLELVTEG
jgi:arginine N-succinyltransferase